MESAPPVTSCPVIARRDWNVLQDAVRAWLEKLPFASRDPGTAPARPGNLGVLCGGSGMGKTALLGRLRRLCKESSLPFASAQCQGRCCEPLEPVLRLLEICLGAEHHPAGGGGILEKLIAANPLLQQPPVRLCLERIWPGSARAADAAGPPDLTPDLNRSRLVDALSEVFMALSAQRPLVLAVDDMQDADELSTEVLSACLRKARRRAAEPKPPLFLLVISCVPRDDPSHGEKLQRLLRDQFLEFEVEARGYSREDLLDECRRRSDEVLPLSQREMLFQKSAGNPLLIHWTLQQLVSPGGMARDFGLESFKGFQSLPAIVQASFEQLGKPEKKLVELLSFLERPVPPAQLAGLRSAGSGTHPGDNAPETPEELEQLAARLRQDGWLAPENSVSGDGLLMMGSPKIAAIIRELRPPEEASGLHASLGERLSAAEGVVPERPLETFHHLAHGAAAEVLLKGGEKAIRRCLELHCPAPAIDVLGRMAARFETSDPERHRELLLRQARHLEQTGSFQEAIELYERLMSIKPSGKSGAAPGPEERARLSRNLGCLHKKAGKPQLAFRVLLDGLREVEKLPDSLEKLKIYAQLSYLSLENGDLSESNRYLSQTLGLLSSGPPLSSDEDFLEIQRIAEEVRYRRGEYVEALEFEEKIQRQSIARGDLLGQIKSVEFLSHLHLLNGNMDQAGEILRAGLEACRRSGCRRLEARMRILFGRLLRRKGDGKEALVCFLAGRDMLAELGFDDSIRELHGVIAHLQLANLEFREAMENLEIYASCSEEAAGGAREPHAVFPPRYENAAERDQSIEELRRRMKKSPSELPVVQQLADLLLDGAQAAEAGELYQQVVMMANLQGQPAFLALTLQRLGRWHRWRGDRPQALKYFEKSLECLGPEPEKTLLGNAYIEVGDILRSQGSLKKSYDFLLRGMRIFFELECEPGKIASLLALGEYFRDVGRRELALKAVEISALLAQKGRWQREEAESCRLLGRLALEFGNPHHGQKFHARAQSIFEALGISRSLCQLSLDAAWGNLRRSDFEAALARGKSCLEKARQMGDQDLLGDALHLLGVVESVMANRGKNFLRAVEMLQNALVGAQSAQRVLESRWVLISLARLYDEREKPEMAGEYLEKERDLTRLVSTRVQREFWPGFEEEARLRASIHEGGGVKKFLASRLQRS